MKKVLVIEDDYNVRSSIRELLASNEYEVFCASDGDEGIQLAKHIKPNLILCDIMMPKLDGYEVLKRFKNESSLGSTPFIFLTAKAEISEIREGMGFGADDYVTKPYRAVDLLKAIKARLDRFSEVQNGNLINEAIEKKGLLTENDTIFVNEKDKPRILKVGEILWIKAEAEYSQVYTLNDKKYLIRKLIKTWEEQLPTAVFLRIHRSAIINLNYVEKIEKWSNRSFIILLKHTDEKFIVSQRYTQKIKSRLFL